MSAFTSKIGSFDWIVSFEQIEAYLLPPFIQKVESEEQGFRALVVGCGTSTLSEQLENLSFREVVSVDNDPQCIEHMTLQHEGNERLKWHIYDLVEPWNDCYDPNVKSSGEFGAETASFDVIIDKGTLDAILVEGAVYTMLCEIHRLLKPGGTYLVCSINSEDLLAQLLGANSLNLDVKLHKIFGAPGLAPTTHGSSEGGDGGTGSSAEDIEIGTIAICRKYADITVDPEMLAEEERLIMDKHFKEDAPLLTKGEEDNLCHKFAEMLTTTKLKPSTTGETPRLQLKDAFSVMFDSDSELDYTYDLFLEDVSNFELQIDGHMSADEAIEFLRRMQ